MAFVQAVVKGQAQGSQLRNVFYVQVPDGGYANGQAVADYIGNAYADFNEFYQSTSVFLNAIGIRPLNQGSFPEVDFIPDGWPLQGDIGGHILPLQVAALIRFNTAQVQPNRKWTFMFGLTEASWDGGAWGTGTMNGLGALALELVSMPTEMGSNYGIHAGRHLGGDEYVFGALPIESWVVEGYARTQRRRRPGVGS